MVAYAMALHKDLAWDSETNDTYKFYMLRHTHTDKAAKHFHYL